MPDVTYYRLDSDAIVRVIDGYDKQIFKPSTGQWQDYEVNLAVDGKEIPASEAEQEIHPAQFGEFAPQGGTSGANA